MLSQGAIRRVLDPFRFVEADSLDDAADKPDNSTNDSSQNEMTVCKRANGKADHEPTNAVEYFDLVPLGMYPIAYLASG